MHSEHVSYSNKRSKVTVVPREDRGVPINYFEVGHALQHDRMALVQLVAVPQFLAPEKTDVGSCYACDPVTCIMYMQLMNLPIRIADLVERHLVFRLEFPADDVDRLHPSILEELHTVHVLLGLKEMRCCGPGPRDGPAKNGCGGQVDNVKAPSFDMPTFNVEPSEPARETSALLIGFRNRFRITPRIGRAPYSSE